MKIKMKLTVLLTVAVLVIAGCGSETSMKNDSKLPETIAGKTAIVRPYVDDIDVNPADPYKAAVSGQKNYRVAFRFSADMDSSTINTTNIYARNITGPNTNIPNITVTYDRNARTAYLSFTVADTVLDSRIEYVVSKSVTDLEGNGLAGRQDNEAYKTVSMDYKYCSDGTQDGKYTPLYVSSIDVNSITSSSATVVVTLSRPVAKSSLMQAISISGGEKGTVTYTLPGTGADSAASVSIPLTNLTSDKVYTVTFNPANIVIDPASDRYPDGVTQVNSDSTIYFKDKLAFDRNAAQSLKRKSDFLRKFVTKTISSIVKVNSVTSAGTTTAYVNFSGPVKVSTIVADNFIVYTTNGMPVQFTVKAIYSGETVSRVELSTAELGQETIAGVLVKNTVLSSPDGNAIDGNNDGSLVGNVDMTGDDIVDDDNYRYFMPL